MATTGHRIRGVDRAQRGRLERLLSLQDTILRNRRQILRDALPTPTSGVMDLEEHALDAEEQGVGFAVLELTSRTVRGIETALQRLAAGEFGTCSDCWCRISDARLRALPFADLCHSCQGWHDMAAGWSESVAWARAGSLGPGGKWAFGMPTPS
jgi:DnaK suppressor protein